MLLYYVELIKGFVVSVNTPLPHLSLNNRSHAKGFLMFREQPTERPLLLVFIIHL